MTLVGSTVSLSLLVALVLYCQAARFRTNNYVSETLRETHDSITDPLGLTLPIVAENPLFSDIMMKTINSSFERREQVLIMNATLDIYLKIFFSLLENNKVQRGLLDQLDPRVQDPVRKALLELQERVLDLKTHKYQDRRDEVRRILNTLEDIQVDDVLVQKKALAEFKQVYQAASIIGSKHCAMPPRLTANRSNEKTKSFQ